MNKKNLIIGGVVLAGIVAYYFYNKNKNKGSVNMPSSTVGSAPTLSSPIIVPTVETRVPLTGMRPKELDMPSIAPPRPIMDRVPLAGLSPVDQFIA